MLECTSKDIFYAFSKAPNINSAVKNFLKKEAKKGDASEKFAKSLRAVMEGKNDERAEQFIADSMPKFLNHLYSIACYAYFEFISQLASSIVSQYADEFNSSFEIVGEKLNYKNEAKFKEISKKALAVIEQELQKLGFENSPFMKNVVMISIFEKPVIEVIS